MKKIKVLFFIYQMGGGGAARTLLNIINNLDRAKFQPVLVTLDYNGTYEEQLKNDVLFIKLKSKRLSRSVFELAKIIRINKIDLIFSTIPRVNTIAILAKLISFTNVKCVIREADNLGGDFKTDILLRFFGFMYKFSNQVISLSNGVKRNLIERYKVKAKDIEVIYNPVDISAIKRSLHYGEIDEEDKSLFNTNKKIVLTAGRLVSQKDHRTLLKAFAKMNAKIPSELLILGTGPLKNQLKELCDELGIRNAVHFLGFKKNPYVYIMHADLFVLSSKHEGFSHVIAEALASETPVVSTNCKSGPEEVLQKGEYGKLCAVGDYEALAARMYEILTLEKYELESMIAKGKKRANDFDASTIVKQYEEVFLKTLNKHNYNGTQKNTKMIEA